jgi:hypothetical protein
MHNRLPTGPTGVKLTGVKLTGVKLITQRGCARFSRRSLRSSLAKEVAKEVAITKASAASGATHDIP